MAITASLIVSPTAVVNGQNVNVTLVLTQPAGGGAVQLLRIDPYVLNGQAPTAGPAMYPGNANINIGAATTLTSATATNTAYPYSWVVQAFAPPSPLNPPYPNTPAFDVFTVGAVAYLGDGTMVSASTTILVYPLVKDTTFTLTAMPGKGDLRFDSNLESQLAPPAFSALPMVGLVTPGKSA